LNLEFNWPELLISALKLLLVKRRAGFMSGHSRIEPRKKTPSHHAAGRNTKKEEIKIRKGPKTASERRIDGSSSGHTMPGLSYLLFHPWTERWTARGTPPIEMDAIHIGARQAPEAVIC
jgi:hypothetical protein